MDVIILVGMILYIFKIGGYSRWPPTVRNGTDPEIEHFLKSAGEGGWREDTNYIIPTSDKINDRMGKWKID